MEYYELEQRRRVFDDFLRSLDISEILEEIEELDSKKESKKLLEEQNKKINELVESLEGKYIHVNLSDSEGDWNWKIESVSYDIDSQTLEIYGPRYLNPDIFSNTNAETEWFQYESEGFNNTFDLDGLIGYGYFITEEEYQNCLNKQIKGLQYLIKE